MRYIKIFHLNGSDKDKLQYFNMCILLVIIKVERYKKSMISKVVYVGIQVLLFL